MQGFEARPDTDPPLFDANDLRAISLGVRRLFLPQYSHEDLAAEAHYFVEEWGDLAEEGMVTRIFWDEVQVHDFMHETPDKRARAWRRPPQAAFHIQTLESLATPGGVMTDHYAVAYNPNQSSFGLHASFPFDIRDGGAEFPLPFAFWPDDTQGSLRPATHQAFLDLYDADEEEKLAYLAGVNTMTADDARDVNAILYDLYEERCRAASPYN